MLIVLSIFEDFGYFICPQTGIGLNSSVHSMGSILNSAFCTRVQTGYAGGTYPGTNMKTYPMNRVHLYPGTNPGKALISTAFEPVQEFISFSHEATGSGEHIVHIKDVTASSPVATIIKPRRHKAFAVFCRVSMYPSPPLGHLQVSVSLL